MFVEAFKSQKMADRIFIVARVKSVMKNYMRSIESKFIENIFCF